MKTLIGLGLYVDHIKGRVPCLGYTHDGTKTFGTGRCYVQSRAELSEIQEQQAPAAELGGAIWARVLT